MKQLMDGIFADQTALDSQVWQSVIKHMYNEDDFERLKQKITHKTTTIATQNNSKDP